MCFCQLAKNRGCAGVPCACPQGCGAGVTWDHPSSVTFVNKAQAQGCAVQKALLTIPKSYYIDMKFLRTWCPWKMELLLREMFEFGLLSVCLRGVCYGGCLLHDGGGLMEADSASESPEARSRKVTLRRSRRAAKLTNIGRMPPQSCRTVAAAAEIWPNFGQFWATLATV